MATRVPLNSDLAESIRAARNKLGLSQQHLADKVGCLRSRIKRIENNEVSSLDQEELVSLSSLLGLGRPQPIPTRIVRKRFFYSSNYFKVLRKVKRASNLHYFMVRFTASIDVQELLGKPVMIDDLRGYVHGIETKQHQEPRLQPGDELVIGLFPDNRVEEVE